ncbi:SprT family zinc-dependent metalloprotease [Lacimicrobium sp. SS2-24]|uniref:SprT family zinc-dependent metalloprotease n=1 Tax=Lacimicrobium sp. SS2-24 TaxID=2005569 RepID=UPI000B4A6B73|nr:SprT family zinc-dependent metalloprotease [Lacimicrobium sp. SS2-24]
MTKLSSAIQQQAAARLHQAISQAEQCLGISLPIPLLRFNQRGRIAGSARLKDYEIRLNPVLLAENTEEFMREVIPHELCHLLVWRLYCRGMRTRSVKPHGKEWKTLMRDIFGLQGKACHQMDIDSVQGRQFDYRCECGPLKLTIRRHNNVLKGVRYICRACKHPLQAL